MNCAICKHPVKSLNGLSCHVVKSHKDVSLEKYYTAYLMETDESSCLLPKCVNKVKFNNLIKGYRHHNGNRKYCSISCAHKDEKVQDKQKKTSMMKHGVENYRNLDLCKKTCIEKYGADNVLSKGTSVSAKRDETVLAKYGVSNVFQNKKVIKQIRTANEKSGRWIDFNDISYKDYTGYYRIAWNFYKNVRAKFMLTWNGYDYYDNEYIKPYLKLDPSSTLYPTVDHKISIRECLIAGKTPQEASDFSNLCVTKKSLNSKKRCRTEDEFKEWLYSL